MSNYPSRSHKSLATPRLFFASIGLSLCFNLTMIALMLFNSINAAANPIQQDDIITTDVVNSFDELGHGTLLFKHATQYKKAAQLNIDVVMNITGMINRVSVTQSFSNTTDDWQEGIYVFPLPENAAVDPYAPQDW